MKQIKREITTYEVGEGFYVDVVPDVEIEALPIPSIINREPKKIVILSTPPATLTDSDLRRDKKIHRIQSMEQ